MAEKYFEVCFTWMFLEHLLVNICDCHILDSEQIWFVFAQESIVNQLEESWFVLGIIFFTASNYWLHEEFFSFLPDGGVIPSVELFGIFG